MQRSPIEFKRWKIESQVYKLKRRNRFISQKNRAKKLLTPISRITPKRPNLSTIGREEGEEYQLKGPEYVFNTIIEMNFYMKEGHA